MNTTSRMYKYITPVLMALVASCASADKDTTVPANSVDGLPELARYQGDSVSLEAVEFYLPQLSGISLSQLMPPFTPTDRSVFLGAPDNVLMVFYDSDKISDDTYDLYARHLYELSQTVADDGLIFRGYEIANDSIEAFAQYTYEDYADNSPMLGWGFRRDGRVVRMYPELKNVDRDTFDIHYICVRVSAGLD